MYTELISDVNSIPLGLPHGTIKSSIDCLMSILSSELV